MAGGVTLGAVALAHTDAWQRFNGSTVADGAFDVHSSGALEIHWTGSATVERNSSWAGGADGYRLTFYAPLSGPYMGHMNQVVFSSRQRLRAGHYQIVRMTPADTNDRIPDMMAAGIITESLKDEAFVADSGEMDVTNDRGTFRGSFGMRCVFDVFGARRNSQDSTVRVFGTFNVR